MNVNKIEKKISLFNDMLKEEHLTNEEFLVLIGNLLRAFSIKEIKNDKSIPIEDINNADKVSVEFSKNPYNPSLACLLQSHVLIKLSEYYKD